MTRARFGLGASPDGVASYWEYLAAMFAGAVSAGTILAAVLAVAS